MGSIEWRCCKQTKTVGWRNCKVKLLDQNALPLKEKYIETNDYKKIAGAITDLSVRGVPAIGVAASYGVALAALQSSATEMPKFLDDIDVAADTLAKTRPSVISLAKKLNRMKDFAHTHTEVPISELKLLLKEEADNISREELAISQKIGAYGAALILDGDNILTHCNAGALATVDYGTALAVIHGAWAEGKKVHAYVNETRPLMQGSRLTAWELHRENIPFSIICDSAAGYLMSIGKINKVVVGVHRIAANGDLINRIGTYSLAVLAKENNIPFYAATPASSIDMSMKNGYEFPVEQRPASEITEFNGARIAPEGSEAVNPASDVTPSRYITGIIIEQGILSPPYESSIAQLKSKLVLV